MKVPKKPKISRALGRSLGKHALLLPASEKLKGTFVATAGHLSRAGKSPDEMLGELFLDVQKQQIYGDGKTFTDLIPRRRLKTIQSEYLLERQDPNFDLRDFVSRHFYRYGAYDHHSDYVTPDGISVRQHIRNLWPILERKNRRNRGSLIALPNPYVVPGGRFSEQFYWDSYFIMRGLACDENWRMIENMMRNYAYMIRKFGFIPTANRTYFLSRSQPPFLSHMVRLLGSHKAKKRTLIEYLPYMLSEYRFWMKGRGVLSRHENKAYKRVAEMPNGILLNRYYDNKTTPRPESLREDIETADTATQRQSDRVFLHLRAAAESGWDFSSRWFLDANDIRTIHTADIIPVDLNCLLYDLEITIAQSYEALRQPMLAKRFLAAAEQRKRGILDYCWDEKRGFFVDYNFHRQQKMPYETLAGVFALWSKIATSEQAKKVAAKLEKDFLKPGGLVTTLIDNGQQWDSPNGWAPLQLIAIEGLRNYGYFALADKIKEAWISTNQRVFADKRKLVEKYDVVSAGLGGGGEYPLQDGFGWTNGVLAVLLDEDNHVSV